MPITRQDVTDDIVAKISGKTTAKSITPTEDGANRELMMDYVDQEIKTKIVKTTITESQILQLFTTPITILDSTDTGKVKYPINIYVKRTSGSPYTLSSALFYVINDNDYNMNSTIIANPIAVPGVGYFQSFIGVVQDNASEKNSFYKLKAGVGNPTGGTGDIEVYVTYVEITL